MAGYLDITAMKAYWTEQGYTIPGGTTDQQLTPSWNRGASAVDRYEEWFDGTRSGGYDQIHAWGRDGATARSGQSIPSGVVPLAIAHASFEAGWIEWSKPGSLTPVVTGSSTAKRKKVGQLEIEYAVSSATDIDDLVRFATPVVTAMEGLLWQFMRPVLPAILVV